MEEPITVSCFFCGAECIEDSFCYGCKTYVCVKCDGAPTWIFLAGPEHEVWTHRWADMQTVAQRAIQAVKDQAGRA